LKNKYDECKEILVSQPKTWLITGVAGFIGSNLLEQLLCLNQKVVGIDNFSTGHRRNLDEVEKSVSKDQWGLFKFVEGDIRNLNDCINVCRNVDYVLHQAALGSVPRSVADPVTTNASNVTGFVNMLTAAKDQNVTRFVYAASSSTYGDHPALPKVESQIGRPLSPYAVTKLVNELYAEVFGRTYGLKTVGLRYFNVFGRRQDPNGAYAAVIPKWVASMIKGEPIFINGDGETSRDFCYIENTVQANILAAVIETTPNNSEVYNVALGDRTTLNELFLAIKEALAKHGVFYSEDPVYRDFRAGDVRHSQADISKIKKCIGYEPLLRIHEGIGQTMGWYVKNCM